MPDQNLNFHHEKTAKNIKDRPKVYKLKRELDDYYFLCMAHKEILTIFYDYYSECDPEFVRKAFCILFPINRLIKQLLVYCFVYHSIWWGAQYSYLNNLALNFDNINSFLFFTIIYYNFYDLIVRSFFMRFVCFNLLKFLKIFTTPQLKSFLNIAELFLYLIIDIKIYYTLKYEQKHTNNFICFLMVPHFYFIFYNTFEFKLTLLNFTIFSNKTEKLRQSSPTFNHSMSVPVEGENVLPFSILKNVVDTPKSDSSIKSQIYTDCSNMSLETFLNGKISIPNLVSSNSNIANNYKEITNNQNQPIQPASMQQSNISNQIFSNQSNQTIKLIRQSQNRTKPPKSKLLSLYLNICTMPSRLMNRFNQAIYTSLSLWNSIVQDCKEFILHFLQTSKLFLVKRNMFSSSSFSVRFNNLQHKCSNDARKIRDETECFKVEYNHRLKEVLNRTFESIYFNFFIVRYLVPSHLNIRDFDFFIYFSSSLISTFLSYFIYCLPLSFIISFNRNTEHLGAWRLCKQNDTSNLQIKFTIMDHDSDVSKWSDTKVYFQGDKVNYMGNMYVAETVYCASIPGNRIFELIYRTFSRPLRLTSILLGLEMLNMLLLFIYFVINGRWYAITAFIIETLFNCHLFFILCRDYFLLKNENIFNLKKKIN